MRTELESTTIRGDKIILSRDSNGLYRIDVKYSFGEDKEVGKFLNRDYAGAEYKDFVYELFDFYELNKIEFETKECLMSFLQINKNIEIYVSDEHKVGYNGNIELVVNNKVVEFEDIKNSLHLKRGM